MTKTYFEGWYCSLYNAKEALALIPSFYLDQNGNLEAAVRLVTREGIYRFPYIEDFCMEIDMQGFPVLHIGENLFERHGCHIFLKSKDVLLRGKVYFPNSFVEQESHKKNYTHKNTCRHVIGSLYHQAYGVFWLNDRRILFYGGCGYIESSKGASFPDKFMWTQCCFPHSSLHSIMTLVSESSNHIGTCYCVFLYHGKEYRLTKMMGAKIIAWDNDKLVIHQDKWKLELTILTRENTYSVLLPCPRDSKSKTYQTISALIHYECHYDKQLLFSLTGQNAGLSWR